MFYWYFENIAYIWHKSSLKTWLLLTSVGLSPTQLGILGVGQPWLPFLFTIQSLCCPVLHVYLLAGICLMLQWLVSTAEVVLSPWQDTRLTHASHLDLNLLTSLFLCVFSPRTHVCVLCQDESHFPSYFQGCPKWKDITNLFFTLPLSPL